MTVTHRRNQAGSPRPTERRAGGAGFTTIELVVTIVVIGIIAVVIMPRLDLIAGFDQSGFRDQLQSSLDYARKAAVAARRYVCVSFPAGAVTFQINTAQPENVTAPVACATALAMPGNASNTIKPPAGVTVTAPAGGLVFDALGRSINATTLAVATQATISVGSLSLSVDGETGLVH